jgi:hypothetical protein
MYVMATYIVTSSPAVLLREKGASPSPITDYLSAYLSNNAA